MNTYICRKCGAVWHSAAAPEKSYYPDCEACGGELSEVSFESGGEEE